MANEPSTSLGQSDFFRADVQISGARVSIVAPSMTTLSDLMARLQRTDTKPVAQPETAKDQPKADAKPAKETTAGKSESASAGAAEKAFAAKPTADAAAKPAASEQASGKPDDVLEYPVLQKAMFTLAGLEKQAALDLNASFGVKTMKDLPETKRREALAAAEAKIAELKSAAEAVA